MLNFEFWRLTCEQFVGFTRTNLRTSLLHRARCVTKLTHKNKNVSWVGWVSKTFKNKNISWALVKLSTYMKHFISPNTGWSLMTVDSYCFLTDPKISQSINPECLKRGLMTRKYLPCWIKSNSDKRLLFAVENKKKIRWVNCSQFLFYFVPQEILKSSWLE